MDFKHEVYKGSRGREAMRGHLNVSPIGLAWDLFCQGSKDAVNKRLPILFILLQAGLVYRCVKKVSDEGRAGRKALERRLSGNGFYNKDAPFKFSADHVRRVDCSTTEIARRLEAIC